MVSGFATSNIFGKGEKDEKAKLVIIKVVLT